MYKVFQIMDDGSRILLKTSNNLDDVQSYYDENVKYSIEYYNSTSGHSEILNFTPETAIEPVPLIKSTIDENETLKAAVLIHTSNLTVFKILFGVSLAINIILAYLKIRG